MRCSGRSPGRLGASRGASKPAFGHPQKGDVRAFNQVLSQLTNLILLTPPLPRAFDQVEVPVVSNASCRASYGAFAIADSMICAGETGKDSCQVDHWGEGGVTL